MVLQMDIAALMWRIRSFFSMKGRALDVEVIVYDNAVVQHRDSGLANKFVVLIK